MKYAVPVVLTAATLAALALSFRREVTKSWSRLAAEGERPKPCLARVDVGPPTDPLPDDLALGLLFHEWSLRTRGTSSPLPRPILDCEYSHELYLWTRSHLAVVLTFRNSREIVGILSRIEQE